MAIRCTIWSVVVSSVLFLLPISLFSFPHSDKIFHALFFGVMVYFVSFRLTIRKSVAFCFILSIIMELAQDFIPYRSASMVDIAANSVGIITVWFYLTIFGGNNDSREYRS